MKQSTDRGAGSIGSTEQKVAELQADIDLNRERFVSRDVAERPPCRHGPGACALLRLAAWDS